MLVGHRFKVNPDWIIPGEINTQYLGLNMLIADLFGHYCEVGSYLQRPLKMIEIGSYMGESAMMFAMSHLFSKICCIEPFHGYEEFNDIMKYTWKQVEHQFQHNTRNFKSIELHQGLSHDIADSFEDDTFDFIYIDGSHNYENVKRDIQLYLPKLRKGGVIAGHDYYEKEWPGVVQAVNESVGKPDKIYMDTSWLKVI
jgi:predicted O-methyltransferase YrrM